jgi:hypothetical protein
MNNLGGTGLWDATDGFYYDQLKLDGQFIPLRSSVIGKINHAILRGYFNAIWLYDISARSKSRLDSRATSFHT